MKQRVFVIVVVIVFGIVVVIVFGMACWNAVFVFVSFVAELSNIARTIKAKRNVSVFTSKKQPVINDRVTQLSFSSQTLINSVSGISFFTGALAFTLSQILITIRPFLRSLTASPHVIHCSVQVSPSSALIANRPGPLSWFSLLKAAFLSSRTSRTICSQTDQVSIFASWRLSNIDTISSRIKYLERR